jgi:hypothetical protein
MGFMYLRRPGRQREIRTPPSQLVIPIRRRTESRNAGAQRRGRAFKPLRCNLRFQVRRTRGWQLRGPSPRSARDDKICEFPRFTQFVIFVVSWRYRPVGWAKCMTRSSSRLASGGVNELLAFPGNILINGVVKSRTTFGYANDRGCMRAKARRVSKQRSGKADRR